MIPDIHKETILDWWQRYQQEDGRTTHVKDVGTLLWLGQSPSKINVIDWGIRRFDQDCPNCVYLGSLSPEFATIINGVYVGQPGEFKQHHDVFFCIGSEKTLIMRFGSDGSDYTSGKPRIIRQILADAEKDEPTFPMIPVWRRALEIYDASNISEVFPE